MKSVIDAVPESPKRSQIDELLEAQRLYTKQLEEIVGLAAEAFGPALHPELCGKAGEDPDPQPCRSPLGDRLHAYNGRLEKICAGLNSLIPRSAL